MAVCNDPNENQSRQYYPVGESQPGTQENLVGESVLKHEGQEIGAEAASIGYQPAVEEPYGGSNDCFKVVRSTKRLEIPCTRNEYWNYKVKVPKEMTRQVPRRVEYTDYEVLERQEPYIVKRCETAYREEDQQYTVQVPKTVTRMVEVKKKVPKTVYVEVMVDEPREVTIMTPETRKRRVKVPYQKEVVEQKYRTVKESIPVRKFRTEYDTVTNTVYVDEMRTKMVPVTKLVHKDIPVYNVVRNEDCADCVQVDAYPASYDHVEPAMQAPPESTNKENVEPYVETYPRYVETRPEPALTYQVAEQYEPQPRYVETRPEPALTYQAAEQYEPQSVINAQVIEDHEPVPVEPVQVMQDSAYVAEREPTPVVETPEPTRHTIASEPHDEQKVQKYSVTQYSAPSEYDTNKDGVLDAQEREVARTDGNLHVDQNVVVENQKELGAVVEALSQPRSQYKVKRRALSQPVRRRRSSGRRRKRRYRR